MQALVTLGFIVFVAVLFWQGERLRIMPVPSRRSVRSLALSMIKAQNPQEIIELGSGWGGMTRRLAKAFTGANVTGVERSVLPFMLSRLFVRCAHICRGDIFTVPLARADIIYCYLSYWHMAQLEPLFQAQLKPGAIVISAAFPLPNTQAKETRIARGLVDAPVYLYQY